MSHTASRNLARFSHELADLSHNLQDVSYNLAHASLDLRPATWDRAADSVAGCVARQAGGTWSWAPIGVLDDSSREMSSFCKLSSRLSRATGVATGDYETYHDGDYTFCAAARRI